MTAETNLPSLLDQVSSHTDVTYGDLALIGAALLTTVTSVGLHGWASPGSTLDYTTGLRRPHDLVVRDFIAWTAHRKSMADGCEERLRSYVDESGWTAHLEHRMSDLLSHGVPPAEAGSTD
ncbi:hypothetical protein GCM10023350_52520 [Nocardioides endophyticus]|uniref:Uncharacterized protein n=1 Tax=Nocardioides endophyticus TaxID=1353775 RepID=A0ABP8ZM33_9ACTN